MFILLCGLCVGPLSCGMRLRCRTVPRRCSTYRRSFVTCRCRHRNDYLRRYPFEQLQPGDSFTVPVERAQSARVALQRFKRSHPKLAFVTRIEGERARIWRVK